jgi:hypothetical protein
MKIVAANTTGDVIDIAADSLTTAIVMDITADALTSGGIINAISDSSNTSARTLVNVKNDNTAAVGATLLAITNDAVASTAGQTVLLETTVASETNPLLNLKNSNADAVGPILRFTQDGGSAGAASDIAGKIQFYADDADQNNQEYASIVATVTDATAGGEEGKLELKVAESDGTVTAGLTLTGSSTDGEIDVTIGSGTSSITTIAGVLDLGDRNITNVGDISLDSLSSDGSLVTINGPAEIENGSSAGATALLIDNNDTDEIALNIDAANIDANVVDITGDAVTTAKVLNISADALTTGTAMLVGDNSSDTGTRNTATIVQNHASATGATALKIQSDSDGAVAALLIDRNHAGTTNAMGLYGINIDLDQSGAIAEGQMVAMAGVNVAIDTTASGTGDGGTASANGVMIAITGDTTGNQNHTGLDITVGQGDTNYHIKCKSDNDNADIFTIYTGAEGATELKTDDSTANAAAHITLNADGAVKIPGPVAFTGTSGTFVTFGSSDTSPTVRAGSLFKTHASTQTLVDFDNGVQGQMITVISTAAVTYDASSANLNCGANDIVTADGDCTQWVYESGADIWYMVSFMDLSDNLS